MPQEESIYKIAETREIKEEVKKEYKFTTS